MNFEVLTGGGEPDKVSASASEPSALAYPQSARVAHLLKFRLEVRQVGTGPKSLR